MCSVSFSDVGLFDALMDLNLAYIDVNYYILAGSMDSYIKEGKNLKGISRLRGRIFSPQGEKDISRILNIWAGSG